jgi:MoaA/NifB/PqqE/SkfB family radical SAM enzyme
VTALNVTASQDKISPARIKLEASSFSQLRCPSCPTTTGAIRPVIGSGFLRFDDFKTLVDRHPSISEIELSNYGEILLNPQLIPILAYADQRGIGIKIENGVNLNTAKAEALEAIVKYKVCNVTCSIDGASQETYQIYRRKGNFDNVIANVKLINKYKKKYNLETPNLLWQFVVFGHNEHEIPVARRMAEDLGMRFNAKLTWNDEFSPIRDKDFVKQQLGVAYTTREEFEAQEKSKYAIGICHQLWDQPQINWDGKILGCVRNFWGEFGGNAFRDGLESSLNSERLQYARAMLRGTVSAREDIPCTSCEMYEYMLTKNSFLQR